VISVSVFSVHTNGHCVNYFPPSTNHMVQASPFGAKVELYHSIGTTPKHDEM